MKRYALAACLALPLFTAAGCNLTSTNATIKTIGQVAANSLPAACAVYAVAKGYFTNVAAVNSASNISIGTAANAIAAGICPPNPPPTDVISALADLNAAWVSLEAATTIPIVPPVPKPTPTPAASP